MLPLEWVESPPQMDLPQARAYCSQLARSHYENFHVASLLLPRRLQQDFYNIYSYCRWSDDLADESGDADRSLRLLDLWEQDLNRAYSGLARHPVLQTLTETIRKHDIPMETFADLLRAFRQDQRVARYHTYRDLLGYCRYSANPVGRLVLYVCGYHDERRQELSDYTCTALQLANFWQDVVRDFDAGRVYLPLEDMDRFGCYPEQIAERRFTASFGRMMEFEVSRTRALFLQGLPLAGMVDRRLAADIELFTRGGLEVLRMIERQGYNVLAERPALGKFRKLRLLAASAFWRLVPQRIAPGARL